MVYQYNRGGWGQEKPKTGGGGFTPSRGLEGEVYLIGCGISKEHLTKEAELAIKNSDVLLYDRLIDRKILDLGNAKKIYVGKGRGDGKSQEEINKLMHSLAKKGKTVARLKTGDSLLFSRGFEEYKYLTKRGIDVRIIPGLSVFSILTKLGVPLTHRKYSSSVALITGTKADGSIGTADADTLIYYMAVGNLEKIVKNLLRKRNPETRCLIVENAFREDYRIIDGDIENILHIAEECEISPPAIFVVGNILKLRKISIKGKTVISFRQNDLGEETRIALENMGANSVNIPLFEIKFLKFNIPEADVYAFTSVNAVRAVLGSKRLNGGLVAIGSRTRKEINKYGFRASVPEIETTSGLEDYLKKNYKGKKIVVFCSKNSNVKGFSRIHVYEVLFNKNKNNLKKSISNSDIIFITSSEITKHLASLLPSNFLNKKTIIAIGPRTAAMAKRLGIHVDYILEKPESGKFSY